MFPQLSHILPSVNNSDIVLLQDQIGGLGDTHRKEESC